jgi:acyl dehydratase
MSTHTAATIFYEDITRDTHYDLGSILVSDHDISEFKKQFNPFSRQSRVSSSERLSAPPVMINALTMRLFALGFLVNTSAMGAPGLNSVEWFNDLYAGDKVHGRVHVLGKRRSATKPDMGLITVVIDITNQDDVLLMRQMNIVLFGCRSAHRGNEDTAQDNKAFGQFPPTQHIDKNALPLDKNEKEAFPISAENYPAAQNDLRLGVTYRLGSYHFDRDSMIAFSQQFDPQPFHLSDEAAAKTHFGALAASGWHTISAFFRCLDQCQYKEHAPHSHHMIARGFYNLRWIKPVFAGDDIDYYVKIIAQNKEALSYRTTRLMRLMAYKKQGDLCLDVYYDFASV